MLLKTYWGILQINKVAAVKIEHKLSFASVLSYFDLLLFFLIVFGIFFLTWKWKGGDRYHSKNDMNSYFLMERSISMPFFVTSLVATFYGGIFGVTRITFEQGIYSFITQGLFWYASYLIFAFFVVDKIFQYPEATSLANLIKIIFGDHTGKLCAVFNLIDVIPVVYIASLGFFLSALFQVNAQITMLLSTFLIACYTASGGLRSVIVSDFLQFISMVMAILSVLIFSVYYLGSPIKMIENIPSSHFDPLGGESLSRLSIWAFIALTTLVDPNFYHRCLACPSAKFAKKGILYSVLFWFIIDCATTISCFYAKSVIPHANAENAYLIYALQILPDGVRGLFCAGIVSLIVSTTDSYLFMAGQTLSRDIFGFHSLKYHKYSIFFIALLGVMIAWLFHGNIKVIWKFFGSLSTSCLFVPISIGILKKKKISASRFQLSCCLSSLVLILLECCHRYFHVTIDSFYFSTALSCFICLLPNKKFICKS